MTPRPSHLWLLLGGALLAGCAAPGAPQPSAERAAACRQRADEVYGRQNRADLYQSDLYAGGTRDAMFSSTGSPAVVVAGLSGRFARERMLNDCLRGSAGNVASTPDVPTPGAPTLGGALPPPDAVRARP